ncbi:LptF/LptG family permease [Cardinium endosymbiont of Bemisia tabaci]|uniref:LptF/LptG family permease n=1 Tax=Cardinium endosymbiont of Bemisia tabaci TaxID=672794 RepID=UPI000442D20D|nr:LptF/LptG family permease [Cardinium endosymbiont of Bemisia tabaci]CDG50146.1 Permease YjgP/YjgQ family protein [Cardinium endosymbiont cBtQ1 of Bemisia tabaci]
MSNISIKKIDKLLLRTFIPTFLLLLILVLFVMVIQTFFMLFSGIAGKGLGIDIYSKLFFYLSLSALPAAFPIAILITSLIVFGNLSESFELTAMRSVGLPLQRILRLPFIFILFLSGLFFYFQNYIYPNSKPKIFDLVNDILEKKSTLFIQEGVFCNNIPGYSIRVDKKKIDNEHMEGIIVYDYTKRYGTVSITIAEAGRLYTTADKGYLVMELTNGHNYLEPLPAKNNHRDQRPSFYRNHFSNQKIRISLEALKFGKTKEKYAYDPRTRTRPDLKKMIKERGKQVVHCEQKIKKLLAEQAVRYHSVEQFNRVLDQDTIEKLPLPVPQAIQDADFILFRDQLIAHKTHTNIASDSQPYDYTLQRVVQEALHSVKKITHSLIIQEDNKNLFHGALNEALYEQEFRFAVVIQCLIIFLLGSSLGCLIKRGGFGISVMISFFFILLEYILSMLGKDWAIANTCSMFICVWLPNFVLLLFSGLFLIKAQHGRGLSSTNWHALYAKIKKRLSGKMNSMPDA